MNQTVQQILTACVPIICLLIAAVAYYLIAIIRSKTATLKAKTNNETANKYIDMASDAVQQAVAYTSQTFVDSLKASGTFDREKQIEAFNKCKSMVLEILSDTATEALNEIYGDFYMWLDSKIEQECREAKLRLSA